MTHGGNITNGLGKIVRRLFACLGVLLCSACSHQAVSNGNGVVIQDLAISPDGQIISFRYKDTESKKYGLGLLERKTGKLTPIQRFAGLVTSRAPRFSADGKSLVTMASTADKAVDEIISIDIATRKVSKLATWNKIRENGDSKHVRSPVIQPGTGNILLVAVTGRLYTDHLVLLDPITGTEKIILGQEIGFYAIFDPYFIAPDEIIFSAIRPRDASMSKALLGIGGHDTDTVAYRLKFGGRPEIILTETVNERIPRGNGISSLSASGDGKVLAFVAQSLNEPTDGRSLINWELFKSENGKISQVTDLRSYMAWAKLSRDGRTAVFGVTRDRLGPVFGTKSGLNKSPWGLENLDAFVVDLRTGNVIPTNLTEMLQRHQEFRIPKTESAVTSDP